MENWYNQYFLAAWVQTLVSDADALDTIVQWWASIYLLVIKGDQPPGGNHDKNAFQ